MIEEREERVALAKEEDELPSDITEVYDDEPLSDLAESDSLE